MMNEFQKELCATRDAALADNGEIACDSCGLTMEESRWLAERADADTANIYERFDTWMKGPHARVQTMLEAFAAGASNERADAEKDATLTPEDLAKLLEETATCTEDLNQPLNFDWMLAFARAILAKSKEK